MRRVLIRAFRYQWGLLFLAFFLLGGAVVHNLYKIHRDIIRGESHRLRTQARVITANLASQIEAADRVLRFLRADLQGLPSSAWNTVVEEKRMMLFAEVIPASGCSMSSTAGGGCVSQAGRSCLDRI